MHGAVTGQGATLSAGRAGAPHSLALTTRTLVAYLQVPPPATGDAIENVASTDWLPPVSGHATGGAGLKVQPVAPRGDAQADASALSATLSPARQVTSLHEAWACVSDQQVPGGGGGGRRD